MSNEPTHDLDDIDKSIIALLQENPAITHSDIAKKLNRSQPAIGARIKKLNDKGILDTQIGVNFQAINDLNLVKVELITQRPEEVMAMANCCPFIINTLKLSGEYNIAVFMVSNNLRKIDAIIDSHFRNRDYISKVRVDIVVGVAKKFILPVDFSMEQLDPSHPDGCQGNCQFCNELRDSHKTQSASTDTEE